MSLTRALQLIEHAIRRRWDEGLITRDADGVFTAFLGPSEVERMLKAPRATSLVAPPMYPPDSPLGVLAQRLDLGPSELDLLAVLLACETDPRAAKLVTYLGGNQGQHSLTFELLLETVYRARYVRHDDAAAAMFRELAPSRPLRLLRCILVDGGAARVALAQGVRLEPRLAVWLLGDHQRDPELAHFARWYEPLDKPPTEPIPALVDPMILAFRAQRRIVDVQGPQQSGREFAVRHAASALGLPLLCVSGRGLGAARIVAAFREAMLTKALLAFTDGDDVVAGDDILAFRDCLSAFPGSVAMIGCHESIRRLAALRPMTTVRSAVPSYEERVALWEHHLGDDHALSTTQLERVAATYNLGVSGIVNASERAREAARFAGERVGTSHIGPAIRTLFDSELTTIARRVDISQRWEDLVLPEELEHRIRTLVDTVRLRSRVLGDWGFARKIGKAFGLTVLFSGEPGTGKSMVAGLIAKELGLDLYVVDLSQISSKWLGETEKNIGRAFDAAEAGHVMLLFDEADSLFAKRTSDVRSSNDRYANQETSFILTRLEQFQGIAFFTTNLASAIDPAVSRRLSANILFQFPDAETREDLWRRMLPVEAPVSSTIDFHSLATRFEFSGGIIRNVVLRAAYLAAHEGTKLAMNHLMVAAEIEYRDRGALAARGRLV